MSLDQAIEGQKTGIDFQEITGTYKFAKVGYDIAIVPVHAPISVDRLEKTVRKNQPGAYGYYRWVAPHMIDQGRIIHVGNLLLVKHSRRVVKNLDAEALKEASAKTASLLRENAPVGVSVYDDGNHFARSLQAADLQHATHNFIS